MKNRPSDFFTQLAWVPQGHGPIICTNGQLYVLRNSGIHNVPNSKKKKRTGEPKAIAWPDHISKIWENRPSDFFKQLAWVPKGHGPIIWTNGRLCGMPWRSRGNSLSFKLNILHRYTGSWNMQSKRWPNTRMSPNESSCTAFIKLW